MCSENKGADQLRSYCEADLHLWFCIYRLLGFLMRQLKYVMWTVLTPIEFLMDSVAFWLNWLI